MTMNYEKLTVPRFQERLKNNLYKSITAARRAIGKADWGDEERTKASSIANRHFGVTKAALLASKPSAPSPSPARKFAPPQAVKTVPEKSPQAAVKATPLTVRRAPERAGHSGELTGAEIIELCNTAKELSDSIRRTAEVSVTSRATADEAANAVMACLNLIKNHLTQAGTPSTSNGVSQPVKALGEAVTPQTQITTRRPLHNEEAEGPRSAVGGS